MAKIREQVFTVIATGVGRIDYSQDVQKSVEPLALNWQQTYNDYEPFALGVGGVATIDIDVSTAYILMLYDFYLSSYPASDVQLEVQFYRKPFWFSFVNKVAFQHVDVHLAKGADIFAVYRVIATNWGAAPIDCYFSAHGVITPKTTWFGVGSSGSIGTSGVVVP